MKKNHRLKRMEKRGVSPLIATVILLGLTIALSVSIFTFSTNKIVELGKITEKQIQSSELIDFEIRNVIASNSNIKLLVSNNGNNNIANLTVKIRGEKGITSATASSINSLETAWLETPYQYVGKVEKIEVTPLTKKDNVVYVHSLSAIEFTKIVDNITIETDSDKDSCFDSVDFNINESCPKNTISVTDTRLGCDNLCKPISCGSGELILDSICSTNETFEPTPYNGTVINEFTEQFSNKYETSLVIYSNKKFHRFNDKWYTADGLVNIKEVNNDIKIEFLGSSLKLKPKFVINNVSTYLNNLELSKKQSSLHSNSIDKRQKTIKFSSSFNNIGASEFEYSVEELKNAQIRKQGNTIIINDFIKIDFDDLANKGYKVDVGEYSIKVSDLRAGINDLDPEIQFFSTAAKDGYLTQECITGCNIYADNTGVNARTGFDLSTTNNIEYRTYLSFNTSSIPDDNIINSAKLVIYINNWQYNVFTIDPVSASYYTGNNLIGNQLNSSAWNFAWNFEGSDTWDYYTGWRSKNIDVSRINKQGFTDFNLRLDNPGLGTGDVLYAVTKTTESTLDPYLNVTYSTPASACTGTQPPALGNWIISDTTVCQNVAINLTGNLSIESTGKLVLDSVLLKINTDVDNKYGIIVKSGGLFDVNRSNISRADTAPASYFFRVLSGASLRMVNSSDNSSTGIDINGTLIEFKGNNLRRSAGVGFAAIILRSNNNILENNVFSRTNIGINFADSASNNTIKNNLFIRQSNAIFLTNSNQINNVFDNNTFNDANIEINSNARFNVFKNNRIFNGTFGGQFGGQVRIFSSQNMVFENNEIFNLSKGFHISASHNLTFRNNRINNITGIQAFYLESSANNTFLNNTFISNNVTFRFYNPNIIMDNIINNSIITNSTYFDIELEIGSLNGKLNLSLYNTTFDRKINFPDPSVLLLCRSNCTLYNYYLLNFNVTNITGQLDNAYIEVNDNKNYSMYNVISDINGPTKPEFFLEFSQNITGRDYKTNYTSTLTRSGYNTKIISINLTESKTINVLMTKGNTCGYEAGNWIINSSLICNNAYITLFPEGSDMVLQDSADVSFDNVTLIVDSLGHLNGISVLSGAKFNITRSNITSTSINTTSDRPYFRVDYGSNFSMAHSYVSEFGYYTFIGQRGFEINTTVTKFFNNTIHNTHYGVVFTSDNNIIENNTIFNTGDAGIFLDHTKNNTVIYNTLNNTNYGIILEATSNTTIHKNMINNTFRPGVLLITQSERNNVSNNLFYNNSISVEVGLDGPLTTLSRPNNTLNVISNNIILNFGPGIAVRGNSNNNTIINNIIKHVSLGSSISIENSKYNQIINNTVSETSLAPIKAAISLEGFNATDNKIKNNRIYNVSANSILLSNKSSNNIIENNNITNSLTGIYIENSSANTFISNRISNTKYGVLFITNSSDNKIIDSVITNSSIQDILVNKSGVALANNNTLLNVTFSKSKVLFNCMNCILNVQWHFRANVSDMLGTPVILATVEGYDRFNSFVFADFTGLNGISGLQNLTEYIQNGTGELNRTYITNYTINAARLGSVTESKKLNITADTVLNFTLVQIIAPNVTSIEMTDINIYTKCTNSSSTCSLTPVAHSNISNLEIRVSAIDQDQNCNTNTHKALVYLCLIDNSSSQNCTQSNFNYTFELDKLTTAIVNNEQQCNFTFTTPKGPTGTPQFYIAPDLYKIYVNVSESGIQLAYNPEKNALWRYGTVQAVGYLNGSGQTVENVRLGDNSIENNKWNPGTEEYNITNWGNVKLTLSWNASDPTNILDSNKLWNLTLYPNRFIIDDDISIDYPDIGVQALNITYILQSFNYSSGLNACISDLCNNNVNETLTTRFHINPPSLAQGTYKSIMSYLISS